MLRLKLKLKLKFNRNYNGKKIYKGRNKQIIY